jgi:uncharacterized LabA/DUF88 family protein
MKEGKNYAFIDSQNLNLGIKKLGWKLDYKKFRVYLQEKYKTSKAYMFLGYLSENQKMYSSLQSAGYILVFKPIIISKDDGRIKGNVDAELVLQVMIDFKKYDKAMIISSDGDFRCLVEYLYSKNKLEKVMSPDTSNCSVLLKKSAKEKIVFMDNLKEKLEYKRKSTA